MPPSVRTVSIPFADLKERDRDLSGKIEEGLGPNDLGIISISDVLLASKDGKGERNPQSNQKGFVPPGILQSADALS
ncbi:hypothetical protein D1007_40375 [Hordeum vulgare]|nr:hypothetical protein D1007_40375 [Hordeum vulgare]